MIYIEEKFTGPLNTNYLKLSTVTAFILMSAFYLFLGPTKSPSILLFPLLAFLLFLALIYVAVWKLSKEAGELEANSYQIVVKDHEIEAIHAKKHFITLNILAVSL